MNALLDVDRLVDDFLAEYAGPGPVLHRAPAGDCPPWCRLPHGHPFLAECLTGPQSRYHESATIASRDLGQGSLQARLVADEYRTPDGRRSLGDPRIVLDGPLVTGLDALSPREARLLAELLVEATEHVEGRRLRAA